MMMDWATVAIFSVSFAFCGLLVFVVSVFGARETTFEEALRQQKAKLAKEKRDKAAHKQQRQQQEGGLGATKKAEAKKKAATPTEPATPTAPKGGPVRRKPPVIQAEAPDRPVSAGSARSDGAGSAAPLVEEVTPRATPEPPSQARKAKAGARKMPIEEVVEEAPVIQAESAPVVQTAPVTVAPSVAPVKKEKAPPAQPKAAAPPSVGKLQPRELISVVKKTALDDGQVQQLIDILLNKQAGSSSAGAPSTEWIEPPSAKGGAQNETKTLQRALQDKETALEEERVKVKSITERMHVLRQELNQVKSELVGTQRAHEDTKARHHQELNALTHRMKADQEAAQRDLANYQTQLAYQISQTQTIQSTCEQLTLEKQQLLLQAQTVPVVDPQIYAELEQLRHTKVNQDSHIADLTTQMSERQLEVDRLVQKLGQVEQNEAQSQQQLSQAQQEIQSLQAKEKASSKNNDEKVKVIDELKGQINELTTQVQTSQANVGRLEEENERLGTQLTEKVERPRADGQESQGGASNGVNGHHEEHQVQQQMSSTLASEESSAWQTKYQHAIEQKEALAKENEAALSKLNAEISAYKEQLQEIQSELETQKAKNNELRTKNWKAMEALSKAETLYQNLLKTKEQQQQQQQPLSSTITSSSSCSSQTSTTKTTSSSSQADLCGAMQKAKSDSENAHKALLQRLFPEVGVTSCGQSHEQWLEEFSTEVKKHFQTSIASNGKDHEDESAETVEQLQKKIANYKNILAHTETMLTSLQDSVESEEQTWKTRLSDKDQELSALLLERDSLREKNVALEESLKVLKQAEEMQEILHDLQQKLAKEEQEKNRLVEEKSLAEKHSVEATKMKEELDSLKAKLVEEEKKNADLGLQIAKFNQVMPQSQEEASSPEKTNNIEPIQVKVKIVEESSSGLKSPSLVSSILQDFSSISKGNRNSSDSESEQDRDLIDSPTTPVANGASKPENERSASKMSQSSSKMGSLESPEQSTTPSKKKSKKNKLLGLFK